MAKLEIGDKMPAFKGICQDGQRIDNNNLLGKKLILYFYPKDSTPGCTAEACNLRDNYAMWQSRGYDIIGISCDSIESHNKFIAKNNLPFNLISDDNHEICELFGTWAQKKLYGKEFWGIVRTTFVIDENGIITEIFRKVDTKKHTEQIVKTLK